MAIYIILICELCTGCIHYKSRLRCSSQSFGIVYPVGDICKWYQRMICDQIIFLATDGEVDNFILTTQTESATQISYEGISCSVSAINGIGKRFDHHFPESIAI